MLKKQVCSVFILLAALWSWPCQAILTENPLLPADQAFIFQFSLLPDQRLEFYWEISAGYYLYQDQIKLVDADNKSLIEKNTLPPGQMYSQSLIFTIPWQDNFSENSVLLSYQGCAENGFCYEPVHKQIYIDAAKRIQIHDSQQQRFANQLDSDNLAATIKNRFFPLTLGVFFVLGILLSFSPCVLPMVPLVINLIIGSKPISSHRAVTLASCYVLGMAGSYSVAGMAAGMLGATMQAWLQRPAILIFLSSVFIILALAQFEIIKLSLPHFNKRLHHWGQQQLQGSLPGAFILGILASLIISPCITPPLIGALTYIGQDGNPFVGAFTLFSLGLGMGAPLICVALLSSMILPKAGHWMNLIRIASGIGLLALAIWILDRIIDPQLTIILWGVLCIVTAVLLKSNKKLKVVCIILALSGVSIIVSSIMSNQKHVRSDTQQWLQVADIKALNKYLAMAKADNKVLLIDFYADWCTNCKEIDATVFSNLEVKTALDKFMLLRIDVTNLGPQEHELMNRFQIYGPPAILFFDRNGMEIKSKRSIGNMTVKDLLNILKNL